MTQLKPCCRAISYSLTRKDDLFLGKKQFLSGHRMIHSSKLFESLYEGVRLTCQELVQGLSVHVPAFSLLDVVDNLEGLI